MLELAMEIFGTNTDLNSMECIWYNEPNELGQVHPNQKSICILLEVTLSNTRMEWD